MTIFLNSRVKNYCKKYKINSPTLFIDTAKKSNSIYISKNDKRNLYKEKYIRSIMHFGEALKTAYEFNDILETPKEIIVFSKTSDGIDIDIIDNLSFIGNLVLDDPQFETVDGFFNRFKEEFMDDMSN